MKSLSEIETVSKRSSRAVGYSWGIAEEVGKNIRMLEIRIKPQLYRILFTYNNNNKDEIITTETEPVNPSLPSNILKALHIPTTAKIVNGIPSSFRKIVPWPNRSPRSLKYMSVKRIIIQLANICAISLIETGVLIYSIPSIVPIIRIGIKLGL